jgi:hypothetical protein
LHMRNRRRMLCHGAARGMTIMNNDNGAALRRLAAEISHLLPTTCQSDALAVIEHMRWLVLNYLMPDQPARRPCLSIISNTAVASPTGIEEMSPR